MEKLDPRQWLLELAGSRGVSLAELSRMIGKNASYLQQFVRKGSPRKLEEVDRGRLARFFGVDEALLGANKDFSFAAGGSAWVEVPRLALGASAGPGTAAEGEEPIGAFRFSARWLREMGLQPSRLSAIRVTGDSMEPTLMDGDEILVDERVGRLTNGIHVVRFEGALLVKRIDAGQPNRIRLMSDNEFYEPVVVHPEEISVVGKVVWKGGRI